MSRSGERITQEEGEVEKVRGGSLRFGLILITVAEFQFRYC